MFLDQDLLDALAGLPCGVFDQEVFRHTIGRTPPTRENIVGARWNPADVPAIYASLEQETAKAEADYHIGLQAPPIRARRVMNRLRVVLARTIDLRDTARWPALGLSADAATGDWWHCQRVGGAAHHLDFDGLLVPSARRVGGTNLVILPNNGDEGFSIEVLESEDLS